MNKCSSTAIKGIKILFTNFNWSCVLSGSQLIHCPNLTWKSLNQNIYQLSFCWKIGSTNKVTIQLPFDEVSINFYMLCPIILNRLWAMLIFDLLSQYNFIVPSHLILRSSRMILNQRSSHTPCAITMNSTFVLNLDTTHCFLLFQVTKFPPRNVQ